mmetsp:Transcript_127212/g.407091  ORF Transcript_127212/g.407091 Transcript_127212/m.407091 type:complete len:297 (-) Transcript_127212:364-1254(-)
MQRRGHLRARGLVPAAPPLSSSVLSRLISRPTYGALDGNPRATQLRARRALHGQLQNGHRHIGGHPSQVPCAGRPHVSQQGKRLPAALRSASGEVQDAFRELPRLMPSGLSVRAPGLPEADLARRPCRGHRLAGDVHVCQQMLHVKSKPSRRAPLGCVVVGRCSLRRGGKLLRGLSAKGRDGLELVLRRRACIPGSAWSRNCAFNTCNMEPHLMRECFAPSTPTLVVQLDIAPLLLQPQRLLEVLSSLREHLLDLLLTNLPINPLILFLPLGGHLCQELRGREAGVGAVFAALRGV